ncbi:MAG: class I SAM-dependent methyltransferase, partial [Oscillospiraceae bacterium]|nr:class I SAM-dependent methyltransferase [Oscillospiraceae bacterium]
MSINIKDAFDNVAKNYDKNQKKRIACFDDYYNLPLMVMDFKGNNPAVLDVGAGTGLCSAVLLTKYPKANITLIDLSEKMLNIAKERFIDYKNFKFIVEDYTQ